jgi:hypothetical protein
VGATGGKTSVEKEFFVVAVVAVAGKVEKSGETARILAMGRVRVFQNGTVEMRRKGKVSGEAICGTGLSTFSSAGRNGAVKKLVGMEESRVGGRFGAGLAQGRFARWRGSPRFAQGAAGAWKNGCSGGIRRG